jgi:hypothetical protein
MVCKRAATPAAFTAHIEAGPDPGEWSCEKVVVSSAWAPPSAPRNLCTPSSECGGAGRTRDRRCTLCGECPAGLRQFPPRAARRVPPSRKPPPVHHSVARAPVATRWGQCHRWPVDISAERRKRTQATQGGGRRRLEVAWASERSRHGAANEGARRRQRLQLDGQPVTTSTVKLAGQPVTASAMPLAGQPVAAAEALSVLVSGGGGGQATASHRVSPPARGWRAAGLPRYTVVRESDGKIVLWERSGRASNQITGRVQVGLLCKGAASPFSRRRPRRQSPRCQSPTRANAQCDGGQGRPPKFARHGYSGRARRTVGPGSSAHSWAKLGTGLES